MSAARKLKTEIETSAMQERVEAAFDASDAGAGMAENDEACSAVFEHGQWWITSDMGRQWSVVDATGGDSIDGFSFELVSEGCE